MEIKCKKCGNDFLDRFDVSKFVDEGSMPRGKTDMPPFILYSCPICGDVFEINTSIVNYKIQQERAVLIARLKQRPEIFKKNILDAVEEFVMNKIEESKEKKEPEFDWASELVCEMKELQKELEEMRSEIKKLKTKATKADKVKVDERLKD